MSAVPIPSCYHTVTPYLAVPDAQGLIDFMAKVFDAKEREIIRKPNGQINHAEVQIGDSIIMLGTTSSTYGAATATLYVYVDDADARYHRPSKPAQPHSANLPISFTAIVMPG